MTRCHCSSGYSQVFAVGPAMPAFVTRMSIWPCAASRVLRGLRHRRGVGHVDAAGVNGVADLGRGLLRERRASRSQSSTVAPDASEALGDGVADALGAAGDDRDMAVEVDLVHGLLRRFGCGGGSPKGRDGKGLPLGGERDQTASGCLRFSGTTPSFFCRLVEEVVYWKVSFFSG